MMFGKSTKTNIKHNKAHTRLYIQVTIVDNNTDLLKLTHVELSF